MRHATIAILAALLSGAWGQSAAAAGKEGRKRSKSGQSSKGSKGPKSGNGAKTSSDGDADGAGPSKAAGPIGIVATLNYLYSIVRSDVEGADDTELVGYGVSVLGEYRWAATPSLVLPITAGVTWGTQSSSDNGATVTLTETAIEVGASGLYLVTPRLGLGAAVAYVYGFSGSFDATLADGSGVTVDLASYSYASYGLAASFRVLPQLDVGGEYALASGAFRTRSDGGADPPDTGFDGGRARVMLTYLL
jgi:hypothetical protein